MLMSKEDLAIWDGVDFVADEQHAWDVADRLITKYWNHLSTTNVDDIEALFTFIDRSK